MIGTCTDRSTGLSQDSAAGDFFEFFFQSQNNEGVTIVMSAGNDGYDYETNTVPKYLAETSPQKFATDDSPYITVGATYHDVSKSFPCCSARLLAPTLETKQLINHRGLYGNGQRRAVQDPVSLLLPPRYLCGPRVTMS